MKTILLFLALVSFSGIGCSDEPVGKIVEIPKVEVSNHSTDLECYSGGVLIYKGSSIGKIRIHHSGGAYQIKDRTDGKEKFVSGDCVATEQK